MNTTSSVVLTAAVVYIGHKAQDKQVSMRFIVGLGMVAIILAAVGEANQKFAEQFGLLILIAAVLTYGRPIGEQLLGGK
jgi:hypothetical protein